MSLTTVDPPSVLGKRSRAPGRYVLHISSSPDPHGFSESESEPHASTSKSRPILINGTLVAHTKKRYKCTHKGCEKTYSKPSRLEEHERSHSGQRPFACETCGKSYLRETHLHAHARSHLPQSDRPFACPELNCEKRFWTAQHLRVHTEWHSGAKAFSCPETNCSEAFAKHHQLRAHRCTVHAAPGTKPYQCEHEGCIQSFTTNQHLRTHSKVHNEKRYTCANSTCLAVDGEPIKFYPTWTALQHHNRTAHPPTCSHSSCNNRAFSSQKGLRAHQKLHEQQAVEAEIDAAIDADDGDAERPRKKRRGGDVGRDWKCDVDGCTKEFKSKKALATHTNITHLGRRDHACPHETCKQTFGYKHLLQRHLAKRHGASSSSELSDEETSRPSAPATANMEIDTITGHTYAQRALEKLKTGKALQCPYPHLTGLAPVQTGPACDFVFSRAYDFRRHLHSTHDIVVEKDVVDRWVRRPPVETPS
ncbi:transcription factor iiia [Mycena alexandri]|uniref:Transcription factor iiia n=1 Tax=Mycena alexandri TaxID=1745969 RepID=A0AAD6T3M1_9AGAR|nr:transcription factor iiia [Mycena alexandri]